MTEEKLEILRNLTTLNPLDALKVSKARKAAEKFRDVYIRENPSDVIGVDYTEANSIEYSLRFHTLEKNLTKDWQNYLKVEADGIGLREYTEDILNSRLEELHQNKR